MDKQTLTRYRNEVISELKNNILPFWMKNVIDYKSGGFNGAVNGDGTINPAADKSVIMAARILWTFSRAYIKLQDPQYLKTADLMFKYIQEYFIDKKYGGVFWLLDGNGKPLNTVKKLYAQGFIIFALAEFSKASGSRQALDMANELFRLSEKYGRDLDSGGYIEALDSNWEKIEDMRLSSKEMNTPKSMNTNLHVMEAYSTLVGYYNDKKVKEALESIVRVFILKIIQSSRHFCLFFDMEWDPKADIVSYGHDIEGSWLITEAAHITGNKKLIKEAETAGLGMAEEILLRGIDKDNGLFNEGDSKGPHNKGKEWWMQAEAMVGFLNAYEVSGNEAFIEKSFSIWEFIKKYFIRPEGEWYFLVNKDGKPDMNQELAGQWKCPYHSGRACLEVHERLTRIIK